MIRIRQVKIKVEEDFEEELIKAVAQRIKVFERDIKKINIVKKSIDARKKEQLYFVYEVDVLVGDEERIVQSINSVDVFLSPKEEYIFPEAGCLNLSSRPVIVGAGPAGLFCAYLLAENGYKPIIIERGEKVEERVKCVNEFWKSGKLNVNSNVQFGEGGAGTFSDGKLNTLVKDKFFRGKKVFEILVENGAPSEILYESHPHIGTDVLRCVVKNIREKIIKMGGEFFYNTKLTDIKTKDNQVVSIEVNNESEICCSVLVLAIGHSARDTFHLLSKKGMMISSKPFAVGLRVQHSQKMINESQYGKKYANILPNASYKLTYQTSKNRGVYSFCMCPGGYVVNASSEEGKLVVNGMSDYKRDTESANSAIVVTVGPKDFGDDPLDGVEYQRKLEEAAFSVGEGRIPVQLYSDFKAGKNTFQIGRVNPTIKGDYKVCNLNDILPVYISEAILEAFESFGKKIKGFDGENTLFLGVESRTSSPVRFYRTEDLESNIAGIYPCGEGAGYAGGITTSAMDGVKVAESIAKKYNVG